MGTVWAKGDYNIITNAARDVIYKVDQEAFFSEPSLDRYTPPEMKSSSVVRNWLNILQKAHFLVLGGTKLDEKLTVLRHIAWRWQTEISQRPVKEWNNGSDMRKLASILTNQTEPSLFLFPDLTPGDIHHDFLLLQKMISQTNHVVLIGTNTDFGDWHVNKGLRLKLWRDLEPKQLYEPEFLTERLISRIESNQKKLSSRLFPHQITKTGSMIGNIPFKVIATQLETPENIISFVSYLPGPGDPVDPSTVKHCLKLAGQKEDSVVQWFFRLTPHQRLFVIALTLMDGLYDDQFFAAFEMLLEKVWRPRKFDLPSFDYQDLEPLSDYFHFSRSGGGGTKIESKSTAQRLVLLHVASQRYRRQVQVTLPFLVHLIKESVSKEKSQEPTEQATDKKEYEEHSHEEEEGDRARWLVDGPYKDLCGTLEKQERLRHALGDVLGDLGRISISMVESSLLSLASHSSIDVRSTAARAMADWRKGKVSGSSLPSNSVQNNFAAKKDRLLFRILETWQNESIVKDRAKFFLEKGNYNTLNVHSFIRSSIGMTISFAAAHDKPNQLSAGLWKRFMAMGNEIDELARSCFRLHTIPLVLSHHLEQLSGLLEKWITDKEQFDLVPAIAHGTALFYQANSKSQFKLLHRWLREGRNRKPVPFSHEPGERESFLTSVALIYGFLDYSQITLSLDDAFKVWRNLLEKEDHPSIRFAVFTAIKIQAFWNFPGFEKRFQKLGFIREEYIWFVNMFVDMFVNQRVQQSGGSHSFIWQGNIFRLWVDRQRPLTEIEKVLERWCSGDRDTASQQIAFETLLAIDKRFKEFEEKAIKKIKEEREEKSKNELIATKRAKKKLVRGPRNPSFIENIVIHLSSATDKEVRTILKGFLPEVRDWDTDELDRILTQLSQSNDPRLQRASKTMKRLFRHRLKARSGIKKGFQFINTVTDRKKLLTWAYQKIKSSKP